MPEVLTPTLTWRDKLKRFFFADLVAGMKLTLKFNVGALFDRDAELTFILHL